MSTHDDRQRQQLEMDVRRILRMGGTFGEAMERSGWTLEEVQAFWRDDQARAKQT